VDDDLFATQHDVGGDIAAELSAAGFEDAREIGRGGYGVVFRCRQVAPKRVVAVKLLTVKRAEGRARFVREQRAMAQLTGHPNIVPVFEVGETESGRPFLVMPYCAQGCIQQRIARLGVLEVAEVLRLGVKIAGALATAHRAQIVHRDVKPANILYTDYGEPALGDFGIARTAGGFETATGVVAGSPAFIAPEILSGEGPSAASDVYGLGASLFAGLTGHAAFERRAGEGVMAQFVRIAKEPLPDLREHGIPAAAAAVVDRAMARNPADRPSARELGELIQKAQLSLGLSVAEMTLPDGLEVDRSPTRAAAPAPGVSGEGRLPSTVAGFVGRDTELADLRELLSASRLVTLIGVGGVGKTTLAAQAAAELGPRFSDGVWWVELAELREGALLTQVVAAALGVRDQLGRALSEALVDFLGQRQALVILDNCEHLVGDVAKLAEALLRECPRLRILATSREVIDIEGEAVLRLDPLSCPALDDDPTMCTLAGYEAVQLFVQRARAAAPGFELDAGNAAAIARCCARVEGLPLAIELAAARMRVMSAEEIAEQLSDRFGLLTRGRRGAVSRRQSLAACVEWSYALCSPAEQQLWCRLSVLAASFELPTARDICGEDMPAAEFLDLMCALVDKSILIRSEHHGVARFRLLETLRDYGHDRLTDSERLRLSRRHAHWYHRLVADAEAQWFSPQQLHWVLRLPTEMPNIREALQFSLTDSPAMAVDMVAALRWFWLNHAMLSEGCQWSSRALAAIPAETSVQRIRALFAAAHLALQHGDPVTAVNWLAEARQHLEIVDDPVTRGRMHFTDGYTALLTGDVDHACRCFQQAMAATDDFEVQANSMLGLCDLDLIARDAHGALGWSERSLTLAESRDEWAVRAVAMGMSALAHWMLGRVQHAEELLQQAFALSVQVSDRFGLTNLVEALGWIAEALHRPRQAVVLMAAAAEISRANGALLVMSFLGGFHTECERRLREQLSAEEFQEAWNEGAALTMSTVAEVIFPDPPAVCSANSMTTDERPRAISTAAVGDSEGQIVLGDANLVTLGEGGTGVDASTGNVDAVR
jgi:serine/threonine-protein kinase PknK